MRKATLVRKPSTDEGTFGVLFVDSGFECVTLELPWRENKKGWSCLPAGTYVFKWGTSPSHGACYQMVPDDEAPNRDHILIHAANLAGDTVKGWLSQLEGCIAPGAEIVTFKKGSQLGKLSVEKDQKGVAASRATLKALENALGNEAFELTIKDVQEAA